MGEHFVFSWKFSNSISKMDSWVILDSMKAGEGQKGRQRELTHQSKNPVVKTEQRVSSIALTIEGARVSHYKMPFSPFLLCPAKVQEEMFVCVGSSQAGLGSLLCTSAHCCSGSNSRRAMVLISIWALHQSLWGQVLVSEWWRKKGCMGTLAVSNDLSLLDLPAHLLCTHKDRVGFVWEHLGPFERQPLPSHSSDVFCFSSAGGTDRSQAQQSVTT